jgi:hypothetical protein
MPKMPNAGHHHGNAGVIRGFDGVLIAFGTTGLNDRLDSAPGSGVPDWPFLGTGFRQCDDNVGCSIKVNF